MPPASAEPDSVSRLADVYRDYPGLRSLILRRVGDPEVAADILQDAAVTTLQKLREGQLAQPEKVGGFLYRVALNHLRNYRRKDRSTVSSADGLEQLAAPPADVGAYASGERDAAAVAERVLEDLPTARDRELLVRYYLHDEDKARLCADLGLSEEHFNRVMFRARNRLRALLEARGYARADLLAIAVLTSGLALLAAAATPAPVCASPPTLQDGGPR